MFEIIPYLYLASYEDAKNNTLPDMHSINCTINYPMITKQGIRISVNDDSHESSFDIMYNNFDNAVLYIDNLISKEIIVIVHCQAGQQRSAAVICAYLMSKKNMNTPEAILFIKSKKPDAFFFKCNFLSSLNKYEKKLHLSE